MSGRGFGRPRARLRLFGLVTARRRHPVSLSIYLSIYLLLGGVRGSGAGWRPARAPLRPRRLGRTSELGGIVFPGACVRDRRAVRREGGGGGQAVRREGGGGGQAVGPSCGPGADWKGRSLIGMDLLGPAVSPLDSARGEHGFDSRRSLARRGMSADSPRGRA